MKFIFLYCFLAASGETLYASQEAQINWKPITEIRTCQKEAQGIEDRLNADLHNGGVHLFESVVVTCEPAPRRKR